MVEVMNYRGVSSERIELKNIDAVEMDTIHARHASDCTEEIAELFRIDDPWVPLSKEELAEKMKEFAKDKGNKQFVIKERNGGTVGMGVFISRWDPWSSRFKILVWPDHRRKGLGREAARLVLDTMFKTTVANSTTCTSPEWDAGRIAFIESLGFKKAGRLRVAGIRDGKTYDDLIFDLLKREWVKGGDA